MAAFGPFTVDHVALPALLAAAGYATSVPFGIVSSSLAAVAVLGGWMAATMWCFFVVPYQRASAGASFGDRLLGSAPSESEERSFEREFLRTFLDVAVAGILVALAPGRRSLGVRALDRLTRKTASEFLA